MKLTKEQYVEMVKSKKTIQALASIIDQMSHADRKSLYSELVSIGCKKLLNNLSYDYQNNTWIS